MPRRNILKFQKIKADYMSNDLSLNETLIKYGYNNNGIWHTRTKGWIQEREKIHAKIEEKIKTKIINNKVSEYEDYIKLIHATKNQLAVFLKNNISKDKLGEIRLKSQDIGKLASVATALDKILKSHRLIRGESTDNVRSENLHLAMVKIINDIEDGTLGDKDSDADMKNDLIGIPDKLINESDNNTYKDKE